MRLRKAKRLGSYVKFQLLPKWTESGELVCCEYVRATYNGNDLGVVTVERLKPVADHGEAKTVMDICERRRNDGPTACHYPFCDCGSRGAKLCAHIEEHRQAMIATIEHEQEEVRERVRVAVKELNEHDALVERQRQEEMNKRGVSVMRLSAEADKARTQRLEEINKHAAAYRKEYAEQDAWDNAQLARQHGDEMPSRSGEVRLFKLIKTPPGKDVTANQDIPPFVYGKIIHEPEPPECTMYHPGCGCNHCVSQEWAMENGRYRPGDEVTGYGT